MNTLRTCPRWTFSCLAILLLGSLGWAATNVPPTPVVLSALQRPGTTFMDIDFRVNDPDDAIVQVAALGFANGGTNLSAIVKITTLVEGTEANVGTNVPANTNLRLTWNVAADWNTNFGNVQVEILAKDGRGLLPFHWITLPSNGPNPEITINRWPVTDAQLLPLWYWLLATGDPAIALVDGKIYGVGGEYNSLLLADGTATTGIGRELLFEKLNVRSMSGGEITRAKMGRYGFALVNQFSIARGFLASDRIHGWGRNDYGQAHVPGHPHIAALALGHTHTLLLTDSNVIGSGANSYGQVNIPAVATNVTAIAAGAYHSLALRADNSVIGWGRNNDGQINIPATATNVIAIAGGERFSLALRADGSVIGWGDNQNLQVTTPANATNVIAIAAGAYHSLALRADGRVIGWGSNSAGQTSIPSTATDVIAIAAGASHSLALRADSSVIGWGHNNHSQVNIPATATNVIAIAAGAQFSLALRADGAVVVWGTDEGGQLSVPPALPPVDMLGGGCWAGHVVVVEKRTP